MSQSLSYQVYSDREFVKQYEDSILNNAWNACYERPSTLSLVPENLKDQNVLDAGCGPGVVSEILLERRAMVTAVDYSPEMIKRTLLRTNGKVDARILDLNKGLGELTSSSFDIVYCSLVIHYIDDLQQLFSEFARVLKPGGLFVFSTDHPDLATIDNRAEDLQVRRTEKWDSFNVSLELYQRSWNHIMKALISNSFEPGIVANARPGEECRVRFPKEYNQLLQKPYFICVRAICRKGYRSDEMSAVTQRDIFL